MQSNYQNYQSMVTSVTTGITQLDGVCRHLSMDAQADELKSIGDRLKNHIFSVGIMGEFKRGKSTVINALLGSSIVPSDIMPCSATLNYVKWDASKHAEVRFKDGTSKSVSVEELSNYITKITEESEKLAENVEDATVYYPCPFCQNGVQIIDTPGLNDDERMNAISESVIPMLDAIIMVTVPGSPFGMSEAEFVRNKIMTSDLGRIIFVVNKIDTVDEDERERLMNHFKEKIKSSVLGKMKAVYGEDSEEFKSAKDKLAGIRIIGVSAKQALKGKMTNNPELIEESGFNEFEKMLSHLLTDERGLLELIHPVNQIVSTGKTSLEMIETRVNALEMDLEEFEKVQKESIEKIRETRKKKKDEIELLKSKGKTLYTDLLPDVQAAYDDVSNDVFDYINGIDITEDNIKDKASLTAFSETVGKDLQQKIEDSFSLATERLTNRVDDQLGSDVQALQGFNEEFNAMISDIRMDISVNTSDGALGSSVKDSLIDAGVMLGSIVVFGSALPGVGGLISGWRDHGMKGAVVGGLGGLGVGMLAATLLTPIGIGAIPFLLITGVASTLGGKAITNFFFGKKERPSGGGNSPEAIRNQLYDAAQQAIDKAKEEKTLENWLKDFCEQSYDSVADNIDQEWENTLVTLEGSLSQIEADIKMNEANKENMVKTMEGYIQTIKTVVDEVSPIQIKLNSALNQNQ
ncbi:MAG: hypothetical protein E7570_07720 [Ruminococcaceae bacterium]|nr:hypothetical protein [Oscillospiraceae bacterium]